MVLGQYIANEYLRAGALFLILFFLFRVVLYFTEKLFLSLSSKTKTNVDDIILKKSSKPLTIIALLTSLIFALREIILRGSIVYVVNNIIYSLLAIFIGYLIFVIVDNSLVRVWKRFAAKTKSEIDDTLGQLFHEVLRITLIVILALFILKIWGVNIVPLLGALGIAGLAVALAFQPTLSNIFSGVSLVIDGTFKVGDVIKIDNDMGIVHKIGLRTTRIKTFDNEMIIIPNSKLANSNVQNFLQPDPTIRVNVEFCVSYGTDPEYIKKLAIEEIEKIKFINKDEEIRVLFLSMGDSGLNFKAMFWVDDISKKWPAHQEAISRIYRRLYKENIEIPFPQRTVWMRDEKKFKTISPEDRKFKSAHNRYFPSFGHEYKEEKPEKEEKPKKQKFLGRLRKFRMGKKYR